MTGSDFFIAGKENLLSRVGKCMWPVRRLRLRLGKGMGLAQPARKRDGVSSTSSEKGWG
jgi:hypothetical protein